MVAELATGLAELGAHVICISPYYHQNRKGVSNYLAKDGMLYSGRTIALNIGEGGGERVVMGVHEGVKGGVHYLFFHNALVFPKPYPSHDASAQMRVLTAFCKGTLQVLCDWKVKPSLVITNDWFTALVPAFTRNKRFFGSFFNTTDFCHICHNLDEKYEGRLYPSLDAGYLGHIHGLDKNLLVDPYWGMQGGRQIIVNPSRAALMTSDTWATVSKSYQLELLAGSPLKALLQLPPHPFAQSNGISVKARTAILREKPACQNLNHWEAKAFLQEKFFKRADPSIALFAFVGRITEQKGVLLILENVERLLHLTHFQVQILVGGGADPSDAYGKACIQLCNDLLHKYASNFWADPYAFFTDGPICNLGADFCLMPSAFEPGGIVQQEFFLAGTPVIAFRTGGLKDTVIDWDPHAHTGNGFTFGYHTKDELFGAIKRAVAVFKDAKSYEILRSNASSSVLDLKNVTLAWYNEFHRMRRCMPPPTHLLPSSPALVSTLFSVSPVDLPQLAHAGEVRLAGSFSNWEPSFLLQQVAQGGGTEQPREFSVSIKLKPGAYTYKYVVDGTWLVSTGAQKTQDEGSNINNIVVVLPAPIPLAEVLK